MPVLARNAATTTASTTARPRPGAIRPTPALLPPRVSRPAGVPSLPHSAPAPRRQGEALEFQRDLQQRADPGDAEDLLRRLFDDAGPRVVVLVDAVAEAHQLELTGFHPGDVAGHAVRGSDLAEHA